MKIKSVLRVGVFSILGLFAACGGGGGGSGGGGGTVDFRIDEAGGLPLGGYVLVWQDEFEVDGLPDGDKWNYDTHANSFGWYNNELQYYARERLENSRVDDGVLIIEARAESAAGFPDARNPAQQYTSARLITQPNVSWLHGFIEVNAKIPCGQGSWPAIWMLADKVPLTWPDDGEIDIMEHVNNAGEIHFSVHTRQHHHSIGTQATNQNQVTVCDGSFHRYQMTWTADEILIGMDDRNYLRYPRQGNNYNQWPFTNPQYLLLNIAVGGDWPGAPNPGIFPIRMEVDYVRVYQQP